MKKINVAINGFGRIGRTFLRKVFLDEKINIVNPRGIQGRMRWLRNTNSTT